MPLFNQLINQLILSPDGIAVTFLEKAPILFIRLKCVSQAFLSVSLSFYSSIVGA